MKKKNRSNDNGGYDGSHYGEYDGYGGGTLEC